MKTTSGLLYYRIRTGLLQQEPLDETEFKRVAEIADIMAKFRTFPATERRATDLGPRSQFPEVLVFFAGGSQAWANLSTNPATQFTNQYFCLPGQSAFA